MGGPFYPGQGGGQHVYAEAPEFAKTSQTFKRASAGLKRDAVVHHFQVTETTFKQEKQGPEAPANSQSDTTFFVQVKESSRGTIDMLVSPKIEKYYTD